MTDLQNKILELMKSQDEYEKWGFCCMGYREISNILKLEAISVSNSMRTMYKKGILTNYYCKDQYDDTHYELRNPNFKK